MTRVAIAGAALLALAGCGVVYTAPSVNDGGVFGTAYGTDLEVRVVRLTHETAQAANLEPYVPPRLPAAFRPDAVASMAELGLEVPDLPPLPSPTARRLSRPELRRGELPPPANPGPYRIGVGDGVRLAIGQSATLKEFAELPSLPSPTARNVSRPDVRRGELPPPVEPQPYQIGVSDVLLLAIREPATLEELPGLITAQARRQGYTVQDDGAIAIPDAGRVQVAGRTLQDAEAAIFEALVAAGIDPSFSLEIAEFRSKHATVGGLVATPTLVPLATQPTLLKDAITLGGGLATDDPSAAFIQFFRDDTIYEFSVERFLEDPAAQDIVLRDGDSIYVGTEYREVEAQRYFEEQLRLREQRLQGAQFQLQVEQLRTQREAAIRDRPVYIVQDDGTIGIPEAGRVRIAGLTLQEAETEISEAFAAVGIDPPFSFEISEFNSQRVSVGGLIGTPQLVPITLQPLYLDEAIEAAGGITADDRSVTTIDIFRNGTVYEIGLDRFLDDPAARRIRLKDGDSVFVGTEYREAEAQRYFEEQLSLRGEAVRSIEYEIQIEQLREQREARAQQRLADERDVFKDRLELGAVERPMAYRAGEVRRPGRFPLPFDGTASLADVLFDEEGIEIQTGDYGEIYVLRWPADSEQFGSVTAYHLNAENAVNLAVAAQLELRPNDVVFVSEQAITSWNRVFSQILPQIFLQAGTIATR